MFESSNFTNRLSWLIDMVMLGLFCAMFYFLWLGDYPLFTPDEGRYAEVAREMLVSHDFITPRVNGIAFLDKPALYYWLQALAMAVFGIHEWSIRFFPAIFGIAGSLAIYAAGRHLYDRRTGILTAIILATTPLYFCGAHYANLDLEVAVLISLSLLAFINRFFITAYVFAAFAFLTKGMIALAFPAMICGLWILLLSRWYLLREMRIMTGAILVTAIILPWFYLVQRANPEFLHYFFVTQQVSRFLSHGTFNNPSAHWFYVPVILLGALPWSGFMIPAIYNASKDIWQNKRAHAIELFFLIWAIVIFVFFSIPRSKTVSYIFPVLPPLAMLTGRYLATHWDAKKIPAGLQIGGVCLALLSVILSGLLFALPLRAWLDLPLELTPTLFLAASELALFAIAVVLFFRRLSVPYLFSICTLMSVVLMLTLTTGAKYMNPNTVKPLAQKLQPLLKPTDTVVNYFKFYQDLPIYLQRNLILVANWQSPNIAKRDNWQREMWYSMPFQNTDNILLNENAFWQRWHSQEQIYVFLNKNYLRQFQKSAKYYYLIGEYRDIILLSNH